MDKPNKDPLAKDPEMMPKQVVSEDQSYLAADDDDVIEQPKDPAAEMKLGTALLEQGAAKQSSDDLFAGARKTTGLVNVLHGADPLRLPKTRPINYVHIPGAYQEYTRFRPILQAEHRGVFRLLDLPRLDATMEARAKAERLRQLYLSRARQMEALVRLYEGDAAPTLTDIFKGCRFTIENHTDVQGNMPNLTQLAVGAGVDAAQSRADNERLLAKNDAAQGGHSQPLPAQQPQGVVTTVTTPVQGTPQQAAPPSAPVHAPRQPRPRNPKA